MKSLLIVVEEQAVQSFFRQALAGYFDLVEAVSDRKTAEMLLERCHFDLMIANPAQMASQAGCVSMHEDQAAVPAKAVEECNRQSVPAKSSPPVKDGDLLLLEEVEKRHILRVLDRAKDNKSAAARLLGISRKTLERKLKAWVQQGETNA